MNYFITGSVLTGAIGTIILLTSKKEKKSQVLLFPDSRVPCNEIIKILGSYVPTMWLSFFKNNQIDCQRRGCQMNHTLDGSFTKFLMEVGRAEQSLDICVYVFTSQELVQLIIAMFKIRHVKVRLITDQVQEGDRNSCVEDVRKAGISVVADASLYYMHHKFCIVDGKTLINGSFNWTRSAFVGNNENVIITSDPNIVEPFKKEYARLWNVYDKGLKL